MTGKKLALLVGLLFVLALGALVWMYCAPKDSTVVVITAGGEEYGRCPLNRDAVVTVTTPYGYNIVEISGGTVRVTEADCQNQVCVHSPALSEEVPWVIACLPHGVVVELAQG